MQTLQTILKPLASLKITVTLIVLTVILVFVGTTAQKDMGAFDVQAKYFYAWGVMAPLKYFFPLTRLSETLPDTFSLFGKTLPLAVPLPGGYPIAFAMLINLAAAHVVRFKITWRDLVFIPPLVALAWLAGNLTYSYGYYILSAALIVACLPLVGLVYWLHDKRGGVHLIHLGLILVLGGELATSVVKIEQQMRIDEGGYANYAFDIHDPELAVIDKSPGDHNNVVALSAEELLKPGATVKDARLPFEIKVDAYYPNSDLRGPQQPKPADTPKATAGTGLSIAAVNMPKTSGVGEQRADAPSAYLTLTHNGQELGRYLVSALFGEQRITVDGKPYDVALRFRRYYKPFQIHLKDFRFDRLTGTEMARNFSSDVRLVDPETGEDRELRIWMNHPLRYRGETFYQSSFDNLTEATTVLQVVRNPSWLFPYIACVVGGLGMLSHFTANLFEFSRKRQKSQAEAALAAAAGRPTGKKGRRDEDSYTLPPRNALTSPSFFVPAGVLALCVLYVLGLFAPRDIKNAGGFDLKSAAAIPVSYEGRVLPMDTLARVSLKIITGGKEDLRDVKGKPPAMQFLLDTLTRADRARDYKMFRIDNSDVIGLMGLPAREIEEDGREGAERHLFSWREMEPNVPKLQQQVMANAKIDPQAQNVFQRQTNELWKKVKQFDSLAALGQMYAMPPKPGGEEWRQMGAVFDESRATGAEEPAFMKFTEILRHYHNGDATGFNTAVADYKTHLETRVPKEVRKSGVEVFFNRVAPFYHLLGFYVLAFVLAQSSFLGAAIPLRRAAMWVLLFTIVLHSGGLIMRMYLQGRPPVTTLYSSAIFIAWGAVLLSLGLERYFKNGVGLLAASVAGFCSLFVAHNLSLTDGDTLRQLQAVLDTNFWLATHVVMITLGYAATFEAGIIAITYLVMGMFTRNLDKPQSKDFTRMVYGILCFAMFFSFVGTVLGGIWADQSWGRFWGWDPKENGAILIVLWNALILHARWGGLVKDRGIMLLAIFGNCVTAWSYFGTNELGVGLHSYGFTEGVAFRLMLFFAAHLAIIALGLFIPVAAWRSGPLLQSAAQVIIPGNKANPGSSGPPPLPGQAVGTPG